MNQMKAEDKVREALRKVCTEVYGTDAGAELFPIQKTRKEFEGDYTLVTFPLSKVLKKSPEQIANDLGAKLKETDADTDSVNVVKGFLNIKLQPAFWMSRLDLAINTENYGFVAEKKGSTVLEYSSPNTNKPLHLGHVRNNLLGWSVAQILEACGHKVAKVNLVNDRGIHICKSMIAWEKFGNGETPESSGKKGDHLVGDYYVMFDKEYKKEIAELMATGLSKEQAEQQAPIFEGAREMLRKWEDKDPATIDLWKTMNGWVYKGFDESYKRLGVSFDKIFYESDTWVLGKKLVEDGLARGVFYKEADGSVWIDMTADGLDKKLLLRSDGTSVYMTQDLGTAKERFDEYQFDNSIYVVGNEQNYHFQVLKLILKKLGYDWADYIYHLSYGMVELPEGKMKSREGTVVDADDLIDEMVSTARTMSEELGKLNEMTPEEADTTVNTIGLGALKYFILKVDPKKTMLFDPKESVDFNGNTGPFIQYTHARIKSVLRRAYDNGIEYNSLSKAELGAKEIELVKMLEDFPEAVIEAGKNLSPAVIANYVYELAKEYNQFYHDHPMLKEENAEVRKARLRLSVETADVIKRGMKLLGIDVPEKM